MTQSKYEQRTEERFLRRYTHGHKAHEKMLVMGREGNEEAGRRRNRFTLRRRAANGAQPVSARGQRKGPSRTGAATLEVLPTTTHAAAAAPATLSQSPTRGD